MAELIYRQDALNLSFSEGIVEDGVLYVPWREISRKLKNMPTVKAVPVRHGRWINNYEAKDGRSLRCSECQMVFWVGHGRDGNYCPNCGAKMDGDMEYEID